MREGKVGVVQDARGTLERAWARRRLDPRSGRDAFRVLNGRGDRAPAGLTLDRYADWLVLTARQPAPELSEWAREARGLLGSTGVVLKLKERAAGRGSTEVVEGPALTRPVRVREDDAVFECDLVGSLGTGLFLDQAETRRLIRNDARGAEVLNLFAYTGAFSVHAALAGAKRVTSVDVSKRALARGRENMRLSGLDPDRHRWFADDVPEHLARAVRRGLAYDLVILDPPSFGRGRGGKVLALERDLEALLEPAVRVVSPGGVLVAAFHGATFDEARALEAVERAAGRRPIHIRHRLGLADWDHPVVSAPDADDRGDYLRTLVLTIG